MLLSILITSVLMVAVLYGIGFWLRKIGAFRYLKNNASAQVIFAALLILIACAVVSNMPSMTPDDDTPTVSASAASSNAAQAPADVEKSASAGTLTKGQAFQASLENGTSGLIQAFMYMAAFCVVVGVGFAVFTEFMHKKDERKEPHKSGKS